MKLSQFDYNLPKEMIATEPASPRDLARLFVYDRLNNKSIHARFFDIKKFLQKGDVLILNDTRVVPARLIGRLIHNTVIASGSASQLIHNTVIARSEATWQSHQLGRKFKILLLEKKKPDSWICLIDGHGRREGLEILFSVIASDLSREVPQRGTKWEAKQSYESRDRHALRARDDKKILIGKIIKRLGDGIWEIKFNKSGKVLEALINKLGEMPLPPYIKQENNKAIKQENKIWYQTVYAKYAGSVAAPTAGLHFTPRLLLQLKKQGVKIEYITLHVGMGTFLPVKTDKIEEHKMHEELAIITPKTAKALNVAKKEGRRIVACGTTSARTLESFVVSGKIRVGKKRTGIFIYPPYRPKFVDALITNFHLPKSTLMMLVASFLSPGNKTGIKKIQELYAEAIRKKYRFYSYGDAMFIL